MRWFDWMWIPWFRFCLVTRRRVVITSPVVFGTSYVFDSARGEVILALRLFGLPVSRKRIPFQNVEAVGVTKNSRPANRGLGGDWYEIEMLMADGRKYPITHGEIQSHFLGERAEDKILMAIRRLGIAVRHAVP